MLWCVKGFGGKSIFRITLIPEPIGDLETGDGCGGFVLDGAAILIHCGCNFGEDSEGTADFFSIPK